MLPPLKELQKIGEEISELEISRPSPLYELGSKTPYYPTSQKTTSPNKIADTNPRWANKTAWKSSDLLTSQKSLETYSCEVGIVFDGLCNIVKRLTSRTTTPADLDFIINFGSPIENNSQKISVKLQRPIPLQLILERYLENGVLNWKAEVIATENTPMMLNNKPLALDKASGNMDTTPPAPKNDEMEELPSMAKERNRRKIKI